MDIQSFVKKNQKYITIILISLFFIKSFQSCNRNMTINKLNKELIYVSDSLNNLIDAETGQLAHQLSIANDSIKTLNFEVKLAKNKEESANKRATAVQSTAEQVRKNTTIKIENKIAKDTISIK